MSNAFCFGVPGVPFQLQERPKVIQPLPAALFVIPHDRVILMVSEAYALTPEQLTGKERWASTVLGRITAYWLLRTVCGLSYPQIGRVMGMRDHTTCMSGVKKAERKRAAEPLYREQTDLLAARLKGTAT